MKKFRKPQLPDVVLAIGVLSLTLVCLWVGGFPIFQACKQKSQRFAVVKNVATLQLAAESYAASHRGHYAENAVDLLPYLPDNTAPVNPYTADKVLFQGVAGDLTYRSLEGGQNYVIKAYIKGRGDGPQLLKTVSGGVSQASFTDN